MISHQYRCIFFRQRKCASTSIVSAFGAAEKSAEANFAFNGTLSGTFVPQRALYDEYFAFAVVRNPWDRFMSGWKYCASTKNRSIVDVLRDPPLEGHDYRHLTRPQHETLLDRDGQMVPKFLIRFERLQEDFDRVCDLIGKPRMQLPRLNVTPHEDYRDAFDDEARALFESRFYRDIEMFGYGFERARKAA